MFSKIAYTCIVYPVSLLPLRVIYLFTDLLYLLLISIFPYRKKVIERNLTNSLPELTPKEIRAIRNRFYHHFTDLLAESIKNLSISDRELLKRITVKNPEVMENLYRQHKSVLLVSGHYGNWEWVITSQNLLFSHQAVGIGMPMTNKYWDAKVNSRRSRFGMQILHSKNVREGFESMKNECIATLILSDQSPGDSSRSYWMQFLHQPTAVLFGCEQFAHQYNQAVVFYALRKIKRGYYEMELTLVTDDPQRQPWGAITEKHTQLLEAVIQEKPQYWLWSHKRWKREVPEDINALRQIQQQKFEERFKS